eukprot:3189044-Amphidinium_carterae.2
MDKDWHIDEALLAHVTGDVGAQALKECWESQCLPSHGNDIDVETAMTESAKIRGSPTYKWADAGTKGEIDVAHSLLERIRDE